MKRTPEDSGGLHTKVEGKMPPPVSHPAPRAHQSAPRCYVGSPPPPMLHLRRPLSRFDPMAHVGRFGLYILAPAILSRAILKP